MNALGELLQQRGWVSEEQLERALERQQQLGGRLGTCLLEIDVIGQELLLQALSEQLGVPGAAAEDLDTIEPGVLALLPGDHAIRSRAVVFNAAGGKADIALLDVGDLTLEDELSFVVGRRLRFHVATELTLLQALAKHYGFELPARFASLAARLARGQAEARPARQQNPTSVIPPSLRPAARSEPRSVVARRASLGAAARQPVLIPLTAEERAALTAVRSDAEPATAAAAGPAGLETSYAERLARAETSSAIGAALLEALAEQFVRVLLFRVSGSRQEISGWLASGPELDLEWFDNYSVGLHQATVFRQLLSSRSLFAGRLEEHPGHTALARCWGGSLEHECMLLPIFVRGHLACVVYGDRDSLGVTGVDFVLTQRLAEKAAIAFERCILRHKLQANS